MRLIIWQKYLKEFGSPVNPDNYSSMIIYNTTYL